jgi:hypothetical protein
MLFPDAQPAFLPRSPSSSPTSTAIGRELMFEQAIEYALET